jgi:SAM-dependent methyltransferase
MSLRNAWEANAEAWVRWARASGHDMSWRWHATRFLDLLPPPGRRTVDLGAGEGRLGRELVALGHRVIAVDASPTMARACATHGTTLPTLVADATAVPLPAGCADLVVAFMSLQDVDDLPGATDEAARLLSADGRLCVAIVHPINSAGRFPGDEPDAPFLISGSYLEAFRYHDEIERDGLRMDFHSEHRPLETYSQALEEAGLLIEAVREVTTPDSTDRWARIPMFLHLRARRP